ncbi:MAG: orotidine-5'-phosphate decarboxylase [Anaerolineales bacterium]
MKKPFLEKLESRVAQSDSLLCIGLDPHPQDLPVANAQAAQAFCMKLIKACSPFAAAFKPNSAFFEVYGAAGWDALKNVIQAIPEDIPIILDAKRGDIASSAQAYATAAFEYLQVDAITANPYLGEDALQPFFDNPSHGVFLLCKTSNPAASAIQDLPVLDFSGNYLPLYQKIALLAQTWNKHGNIGLVVGATYPQDLKKLREKVSDCWFLVPGVGAQGGDLENALLNGLRADGKGLIINVSRSISRAPNPAQAASELVQQIRDVRQKYLAKPSTLLTPFKLSYDLQNLADGLYDSGCVKFGQFTLKSGLSSPIYIDLRRLVSYPKLLIQVASAYLPLLSDCSFQRLAALPYAALPIATTISLLGNYPWIYPRREAKDYGTKAEIEGDYRAGETVVLIDDLATTGGSKFEALEKLSSVGLIVKDTAVLIDRQSGAAEALAERGVRLHSVFTLTQLTDYWEKTKRISSDLARSVREFIQNTSAG